MPYPARKIPFNARDFATHKSLQRVAAFNKGADAGARQVAIDYVVTAHGFSKDDTQSLLYDPGLNQPGRNVAGDVRIGPPAFAQDLPWLAGVVFHELVHSPQYAYYAAQGVTQIDPNRSDPERLMIALDEHEAYWWSLQRSVELGLAQAQQAEIRKRAQFALIDLDEPAARSLAQKQKFDAARDVLIGLLKAKSGNAHAGILRRNTTARCA